MSAFRFDRAADRRPPRPGVMGILNVTPDSFSDGGRFYTPEAALAHADALIRAGADMLDVGAQSTRPGYTEIPPEEEWTRLAPVLAAVCRRGVPGSVDTYFPAVAGRALDAGAAVINDVSGDPDGELAALVAAHGAGLILTCPIGGAGADVVEVTRRWFAAAWERCRRAGLSGQQICLDPGIGFGTTREEDYALIDRLPEWRRDLPDAATLIGVSRKRVTAWLMRDEPLDDADRRVCGTARLQRLAARRGADWLRTHDAGAARRDAAARRESRWEGELHG